MVLQRLFLSIKTKVSVFLVLWISLTACNICQRAISQIIIHQSMLHELLSNLVGSLLLYYDFILIYLLWYIQAAHIAWIYLLWWIRLIRQQSVVDCSSSGVVQLTC